jgi:redox-sensitive bicupin YhaK (pirin superfamily)
MIAREIRLVREARPTLEGAGVHLRRAFGHGDESLFDPFLMMDDFRGDRPALYERGFPWHPHRGIETITYMIEGECAHSDSMGNSGTICAGDVQWMTAGSGILHQEMPRGNELGRMGGFQLWANLPAVQKMRDPRYHGIESAQIPQVEAQGALLRIIAGRVDQTVGPVADITVDPLYLDVTLAGDAAWTCPTVPGYAVFAYLFDGEGRFGGSQKSVDARQGTLLLFGDGDAVTVTAGRAGARFLLVSGRPLHEPVAWRGPIVMNTLEELDEAWRELDAGTFVKRDPTGK